MRLSSMSESQAGDGSLPFTRRTQAPIRALIVDDEPLGRERVRSLLERSDEVEVLGECSTGLEAVRAIGRDAPELVFLDVEMPELDGLGVVEAIEPERCPHVIFTTAHDRYLQRAFEVHALDYLRKPYTDERFRHAFRHACRRVEEHRGRADADLGVLSLLAELRERTCHRVVVREKEGGTFQVLRAEEIDWIEAEDGAVVFHLGKRTCTDRYRTLAEVEQQLDPLTFLRIHRSCIVNRTRIRSVKPLWKGEYLVTLEGGKSLGTGRTYRAAVETFLGQG